MQPYSLYLHIPFCRHRCSYCDFNTYAGQESRMPAYVDALCAEIRAVSRASALAVAQPLPVHTIFYGGGTPSLLSVDDFRRLQAEISAGFHLLPGLEQSLEANPGTVSLDGLAGLRQLGFNRISFGMQTANLQELRLLRRIHDPLDVIRAVSWARQAGFDNLNLDLIFALPGQTLPGWQDTLERALDLRPEHLSLYSLIVEPETAMYNWVQRGLVPQPDDDVAADMYEWAALRLEKGGYQQYEISNWALAGADGTVRSCRHNLQYWQNDPYIGLGAGAHGFCQSVRTANVKGLEPYTTRCLENGGQPVDSFPAGPAVETLLAVDRFTEMQETMMVGLRLTRQGVSRTRFAGRFGQPPEEVFSAEIRSLIKRGLLECGGPDGDALRLTPNGRLLGNQVFMAFVND